MEFKNQADFVVTKCGGVQTVADWTGVTYHQVWNWINRSSSGFVPSEYQGKIIMKARENGIDLTERDLIFPPLSETVAVEGV